MDQLSDEISDRLLTRFMYIEFIKKYSIIFEYPKNENKHSRYVWKDDEYRKFMLNILKSLEPIKEEANSYLYNELDEFSSVIFFMEGKYKVGYSINNKYEYLNELYSTNVIGAFGATFGRRSLFIYKTHTLCTGFFIRKKKWL